MSFFMLFFAVSNFLVIGDNVLLGDDAPEFQVGVSAPIFRDDVSLTSPSSLHCIKKSKSKREGAEVWSLGLLEDERCCLGLSLGAVQCLAGAPRMCVVNCLVVALWKPEGLSQS